MDAYKIMTFESVQDTLKAEREIRAAGFAADAISVPRHLSDECGIALRFAALLEEQITALLSDREIPHRGIYNDSDR